MEKLKEYGLEPKVCGAGVTATLGKAGKAPVTQGGHGCASDAGGER